MSHDVQTAENEEKQSPLFYCFEGWAQGSKKDLGKGERERERECGQGRGAAKLEQKGTENTEITATDRKSRYSNIK